MTQQEPEDQFPTAFGQPSSGYGPPPGYGQPGAYPAGYGSNRGTNTLAIVSFVLVFFFWPAALVTGFIARSQVKRSGEGGGGLALAAIIISSIFLVLTVLVIILIVAAANSSGGCVHIGNTTNPCT